MILHREAMSGNYIKEPLFQSQNGPEWTREAQEGREHSQPWGRRGSRRVLSLTLTSDCSGWGGWSHLLEQKTPLGGQDLNVFRVPALFSTANS